MYGGLPVGRQIVRVFGDETAAIKFSVGNAALDQVFRRRHLSHLALASGAAAFAPYGAFWKSSVPNRRKGTDGWPRWFKA